MHLYPDEDHEVSRCQDRKCAEEHRQEKVLFFTDSASVPSRTVQVPPRYGRRTIFLDTSVRDTNVFFSYSNLNNKFIHQL